jgi:nucleoside 2-deoxyribosyltransferase
MGPKLPFLSNLPNMTISVVGGVYFERCLHPAWDCIYGSAGRAAIAIARMGVDAKLISYFSDSAISAFRSDFSLQANLIVEQVQAMQAVQFQYTHDSAHPEIIPSHPIKLESIRVTADHVLRFGMMEGDAIVNADSAVYDPQNKVAVSGFFDNGSTAKRVAFVLNLWEARLLVGCQEKTAHECAEALASMKSVDTIVIKCGPRGALVYSNSKAEMIPAYRTQNVWKIGSGDCFAAHFALAWMEQGQTAVDSANFASRATAFFCEKKALPTPKELTQYAPPAVIVSDRFSNGFKPTVYLAGPFFDLPQLWLVNEARQNLRSLGLKVFSPFHDVGLGSASDVVDLDLKAIDSADILFAIADGLDSGTIYEIGYARAKGKPVVVLSEREGVEALKMMVGSGCIICGNYTTALYITLWEASRL